MVAASLSTRLARSCQHDHQVPPVPLRSLGSSVSRARQGSAQGSRPDRLACEAWTKRMLGFRGPAQPSPTLGDALNAGYCCLEVRCLGCDTHQTVALDIA